MSKRVTYKPVTPGGYAVLLDGTYIGTVVKVRVPGTRRYFRRYTRPTTRTWWIATNLRGGAVHRSRLRREAVSNLLTSTSGMSIAAARFIVPWGRRSKRR